MVKGYFGNLKSFEDAEEMFESVGRKTQKPEPPSSCTFIN